MALPLVLGMLAIAFTAYFLHLFFQLNKAERRLQDALTDVEASMLQRFGKPMAPKTAESSEKTAPPSSTKKA